MTLICENQTEHSDFDQLARACQERFTDMLNTHGPSVFVVDTVEPLWEIYLGAFPEEERQHHNCRTCRQFIERFGSLCVMTKGGRLESAIWPRDLSATPRLFAQAVSNLGNTVENGKVVGVYLWSGNSVWGTPTAGGWTHFAVTPPRVQQQRRDITASQAMAAKKEDFRTLKHGLADYQESVVAQAVTLLEADSLYRGDQFVGPARFLLDLHRGLDGVKSRKQRDHLVWKAVASAPAGWCQPRSSMIGTLLDDLKAGIDLASVKQRFAAKMQPTQYLRPQAAPTAGNVRSAEKLFAELNLEPALHRRFARLEEVEKIWEPRVVVPRGAGKNEVSGSVFGHLLQPEDRKPSAVDPAATVVTFDKFRKNVLPKALKIEVLTDARHDFGALVTAVNPDAPPLLKWDTLEQRNPVAWYRYISKTKPSDWGLSDGWQLVTGVALEPASWNGRSCSGQKSAMFVLQGARDVRNSGGLALFPETLHSDLHAVRATIEAYSNKGRLEGVDEASACGIFIGTTESAKIRVTSDTGVALYRVDRWD